MKNFEKIIKTETLLHVEQHLDPLQFAYGAGRGVEDAVVTLLHTWLDSIQHYPTISAC